MTLHAHTVVPMVISGVLTLITSICAHWKTSSKQVDEYRYPAFLGYLFGFVGNFFLVLPFIFGVVGDAVAVSNRQIFLLVMLPFSFLQFLAAIYFFRFKIVISDQTLVIRGFKTHLFSMRDIVDVTMKSSGANRELVILFRQGNEFIIGGQLLNFIQFATIMRRSMNENNNEIYQGKRSVQYRGRMTLAGKIGFGMMALSLLTIVVALFGHYIWN